MMRPISSEHIARIDDENSFEFLTDYNRVEIALTLLGLKPAFVIAWWKPIAEENSIRSEARELEQFLLNNHLIAQSIFSIENQSIWCRFYCANDNKTLTRLIYTEFVEGNPEAIAKDRERGILLGYADTAIDAYVNDKSISDDELPDVVKASPEFKFVGSKLSKQHWQTEFSQIKQNVNILKKSFPKLYERTTLENSL